MNKKQLSERNICTKFITPALKQAGWDITTQVREEFSLTKGHIIVRGKLHTRAKNLPASKSFAPCWNSSSRSVQHRKTLREVRFNNDNIQSQIHHH